MTVLCFQTDGVRQEMKQVLPFQSWNHLVRPKGGFGVSFGNVGQFSEVLVMSVLRVTVSGEERIFRVFHGNEENSLGPVVRNTWAPAKKIRLESITVLRHDCPPFSGAETELNEGLSCSCPVMLQFLDMPVIDFLL